MEFVETAFRTSLAAAGASALLALSACGGGDREAEAETPVSEAEVSTELPETVISDEQLEATANAAADLAASPPAQVLPVPVPGGQGAAGAGQAGAGQAGAGRAGAGATMTTNATANNQMTNTTGQ